MKFIIVTGVSGAGKSQVAKYLEDLGYFCVDNLPPILIPKFAEILRTGSEFDKIALVIDIRGGKLLKELFPGLDALEELGIPYEIVYLDANDQVLIKRFKEARRTHPLSKGNRIIKGINTERELLAEIKNKSKHIIDTSNLSIRMLKEEITNIFVKGNDFHGIIISVVSFGFKYGVPTDCDLVFDVRFIPNPFYIKELKKLSGKEQGVKDYVFSHEATKVFVEKTTDMLKFLIPHYKKEGKSQLVIGIGCTGGRHRSVAISEEIKNILTSNNHRVIIEHININKDHSGVEK